MSRSLTSHDRITSTDFPSVSHSFSANVYYFCFFFHLYTQSVSNFPLHSFESSFPVRYYVWTLLLSILAVEYFLRVSFEGWSLFHIEKNPSFLLVLLPFTDVYVCVCFVLSPTLLRILGLGYKVIGLDFYFLFVVKPIAN